MYSKEKRDIDGKKEELDTLLMLFHRGEWHYDVASCPTAQRIDSRDERSRRSGEINTHTHSHNMQGNSANTLRSNPKE